MTNPDFQGVTGISWAPCARDEALCGYKLFVATVVSSGYSLNLWRRIVTPCLKLETTNTILQHTL